MSARHSSKVLIVGSGAAGYTAAIYAARANLKPVLVKGLQPGGQLTITTDVENYPGFAAPIQGPWLMEQMQAQTEHVGARLFDDVVVDVDLTRRPFTATGDSGDTYVGDTLIVATGASARWIGLASEEKFKGFGVSACATCDGFFFKGKKVAVIGGGNTAAEEAMFLTNFAESVTLVHRRNALRAEKILQDRLFRNPKVSVVWDSVLDEVVGSEKPRAVTGARIRGVKSGDVRELPVHGIFIAIGHLPNTELFRGKLDMDREGYLLTRPGTTLTNVQGVFAAGDVQDKVYRQAVTAAGTGCMAALDAGRFLAEHETTAEAAE
ncbi:MAG: thioredoxin-disulfide reductase [Rhodospirillales bacterium]|nr:thioredoxin-disulfide reductase [Rhodospirillales bacterium]